MFEDDKASLAQLGYSAEEIEATLKLPHGGSRKGKGGETAAWARFNTFMDAEAKPEKNDPEFVALGAEFGAAGALYVEDGQVDPWQWKNLSQPNGWTQLSKYMACGCISPREMYHTLSEKQGSKTLSGTKTPRLLSGGRPARLGSLTSMHACAS
jgi:deoxyribodipyrimidine photolyase